VHYIFLESEDVRVSIGIIKNSYFSNDGQVTMTTHQAI